jgi:hypothetical protein
LNKANPWTVDLLVPDGGIALKLVKKGFDATRRPLASLSEQ